MITLIALQLQRVPCAARRTSVWQRWIQGANALPNTARTADNGAPQGVGHIDEPANSPLFVTKASLIRYTG